MDDLGRVFLFEEVDGEEDIMGGEGDGGAGDEGKEMGNVLHLNEGHSGLFESYFRARGFQAVGESGWRRMLAEDFLEVANCSRPHGTGTVWGCFHV